MRRMGRGRLSYRNRNVQGFVFYAFCRFEREQDLALELRARLGRQLREASAKRETNKLALDSRRKSGARSTKNERRGRNGARASIRPRVLRADALARHGDGSRIPLSRATRRRRSRCRSPCRPRCRRSPTPRWEHERGPDLLSGRRRQAKGERLGRSAAASASHSLLSVMAAAKLLPGSGRAREDEQRGGPALQAPEARRPAARARCDSVPSLGNLTSVRCSRGWAAKSKSERPGRPRAAPAAVGATSSTDHECSPAESRKLFTPPSRHTHLPELSPPPYSPSSARDVALLLLFGDTAGRVSGSCRRLISPRSRV